MAEHPALSAAVLGFRLGGEDSTASAVGSPTQVSPSCSTRALAMPRPSGAGRMHPWVWKPVDGRPLINAVARILHEETGRNYFIPIRVPS